MSLCLSYFFFTPTHLLSGSGHAQVRDFKQQPIFFVRAKVRERALCHQNKNTSESWGRGSKLIAHTDQKRFDAKLWRRCPGKKKHTKPTSLKNLRHRISHNLDPSPKIKFSHRDLDSAVFKLDCYPQSLAPVRRPNFSNPLRQDWWWFKLSPMGYPLINIEKAMETHHFYR